MVDPHCDATICVVEIEVPNVIAEQVVAVPKSVKPVGLNDTDTL
jgi:hypothetical protein